MLKKNENRINKHNNADSPVKPMVIERNTGRISFAIAMQSKLKPSKKQTMAVLGAIIL